MAGQKKQEECFLSIETDDLKKTYGLKIPEITKCHIDQLTPVQKKTLNERLMETMDEFLHVASYKKGKYLKSDADKK